MHPYLINIKYQILKFYPEIKMIEDLCFIGSYDLDIYCRRLKKNRNQVKKDVEINSRVINVLNFLIEKVSVQAYLLRKDII